MLRRRPKRRRPPCDDIDGLFSRYLGEWPVLSALERGDLVERVDVLLATKSWEAARGFELTDEMCTVIAAQAALVALNFDLQVYRHVRAIVVHPRTIRLDGERPGSIPGVFTSGSGPLDGEAHHDRGPIILAWDAVRHDTRHRGTGRNVVVHEFAHKLDMSDGLVDGTPGDIDPTLRRRWEAVCEREFDALSDAGPEPRSGSESGPGPGSGSPSIIREYAATDRGEFFAVVAELFFERPVQLQAMHPDLYEVFRDFFRQDPIARRPGSE